MPPRILILHDYFLYRGGGERLVISLAKGLGADIATAFIAKDAFNPRDHDIRVFELFHESFLSRLPGFRYLQVQLAFLFKTKFIKNYDVIIYSGDCLVALLRAHHKINLAYMHTPPRHLYDCYADRLREYGWLKALIFVPFVAFNRWRFKNLAKRLDLIVTNSENTKNRIKKYLELEATVVYPPCDTIPFKNLGQGDYFFSWARLYKVKRVDYIVEAFRKLPDKKLVVASGGPELQHLRELAKDYLNIKILGWISDNDLLSYLGNCLATIYIPIREDFGMSAVESMSAGKLVIGVAEGGLREIIKPEENGVLLPENFAINDLVAAIQAITPERAKSMEPACYATARNFTEERFIGAMRSVIDKMINR